MNHCMNINVLGFLDTSIGTHLGDGTFMIGDSCAETLETLKDRISPGCGRQSRNEAIRHLLKTDVTGKTLLPLIMSIDEAEEFDEHEKRELFYSAVSLVTSLSQLLVEPVSRPETSNLNSGVADGDLLVFVKLFEDPDVCDVLLKKVTSIMWQCEEILAADIEASGVTLVNDVVFLLRNVFLLEGILVSETEPRTTRLLVLRNMMNGGFENILLSLSLSEQKEEWCFGVVQLLSLMYEEDFPEYVKEKDTQTSTHNNTCPRDVPMISNSKSSSDNLQQQMDSEQYETLREKYDSMADVFMHCGLGNHVETLVVMYLQQQKYKKQNENTHIDVKYLPWLVVRFLKIDMSVLSHQSYLSVRTILSDLVINFFVVMMGIEVEHLLCHQDDVHVKQSNIESVTLLASALERISDVILFYFSSDALTAEDKQELHELQVEITKKEEIRLFFIMALRKVELTSMTSQLTQKLVMTHHNVMLMAENIKDTHKELFHLSQYIQEHVATKAVMAAYGGLLSDVYSTPKSVKMCVLYMMYHVAADGNNWDAILQVPIMNSVFTLLKSSDDIDYPEDVYMMIDVMIHKFSEMFETDKQSFVQNLLPELHSDDVEERGITDGCLNLRSVWSTNEETALMDVLMSLTSHVKQATIDDVQRKLKHKSSIEKTKKEIALMFYHIGMLSAEQCVDELGAKPITDHDKQLLNILRELLGTSPCADAPTSVNKDDLPKDFLHWLSSEIKHLLYVTFEEKGFKESLVIQPMVQFCVAIGKPFPLVPYTEAQEDWLSKATVRCYLDQLGFSPPQESHHKAFYHIHQYTSLEFMEQLLREVDPNFTEEIDLDCMIQGVTGVEEFTDAMALDQHEPNEGDNNMKQRWHCHVQIGNKLIEDSRGCETSDDVYNIW